MQKKGIVLLTETTIVLQLITVATELYCETLLTRYRYTFAHKKSQSPGASGRALSAHPVIYADHFHTDIYKTIIVNIILSKLEVNKRSKTICT